MTNEAKKFFQDWVALLRSGTIKQGKHKLHLIEDDAMCCLGVACMVAGLNPKKCGDSFYSYGVQEDTNYLPEELASKFGIWSGKQEKLTKMNDIDGKNFEEIANAIEEMFLKEVSDVASL